MDQTTSTISTQDFRRTIAELSQRQAQADALFDSIGQGAIATDKDGKINRINQTALDLLGRKRDEMMGKWFPEAVVAENAQGKTIPPMDRSITKAFLTGHAITQRSFYQRKVGASIPVTVTVSPVMLDGQPVGAVEVFRDITHELEVDTMKTEFIYLASHQLRTPLTAVKTYTHMLHEGYYGDLTVTQQNATQTVLDSLDRMNEIISKLLNISRIEAGKISVLPSEVLLNGILHECLAEFDPIIKAKQLSVQTNLRKQEALSTDPVLAKEICSNLLSNAIKYTPEGGQIKVSLSHTKDKQTVRIQDSGYGIPAASQNLLFTKFYRAPNVLDTKENGTGLGLYLVKGLAAVLGGEVWFDSKIRQGSSFYFSIPLIPPVEKEEATV